MYPSQWIFVQFFLQWSATRDEFAGLPVSAVPVTSQISTQMNALLCSTVSILLLW